MLLAARERRASFRIAVTTPSGAELRLSTWASFVVERIRSIVQVPVEGRSVVGGKLGRISATARRASDVKRSCLEYSRTCRTPVRTCRVPL